MNMEFLGHPVEVPSYTPPTSWLRHGPFAMWLVRILQPQLIVELGSHWGYSYYSFCQSVRNAGLSTRCYAVDTWQGDEHASFYGSEVYEIVQAENVKYNTFSTLLRKKFSDALDDIDDGSVDLLHIDGRHFYEDVKEDFESWAPKLSKRAVVLFHDTEVRERGFGVWRYWSEITGDRPSINFPYQHGLGVLFWGTEIASELGLFASMLGDPKQVKQIYELFERAGDEVANRTDLKSYHHELANARNATSTLEASIAITERDLAAAQTATKRLSQELEDARRITSTFEIRAAKAEKDLTLALIMLHKERRYPLRSLRNKLSFKMLRALSKARPPFSARATEQFQRSAEKRNPNRGLTIQIPMVRAASTERMERAPQSLLRRVAFHRNGKPRGWVRRVALSTEQERVRPSWRRAFYKKNGMLRPDFAGFIRTNPQYFSRLPEFKRALSQELPLHVDSADRLHDQEVIARQIFTCQQAELTPDIADKLIAGLHHKPLISVIMPVYKTPVKWLRRAVESLQQQYYENWELCVVDDCSPSDDQRALLMEMAENDPRIRLAVMSRNGGISAASNLSLQMAKGEFIALIDHDDEITRDAFLRMVEAISFNPEADFLYSDECKIDDTPERRLFDFVLKPDWSPEIMLNFMITGHLTVYRADLVRRIGGFRSDYDFSQDYDLALRMSEEARAIVHVERILYLWRAIAASAAAGGKDFARESNVAALDDALKRRKISATTEIEPFANSVRVALPKAGARVSVVIPSDSAKNLRLALDALRQGTGYHDYEVCVVCNSRVADELQSEYRDWPPARFVRYDQPYNFSDKCNRGAEAADGDIVVFYNDDVFPIGRDWIERLIEFLWVPGVGATSPQLLYEDGTIQYAGMISGVPGIAGTAFHRLPLNHTDQFQSMNRLVRNISILSGACCAMRRDLFLEIGGFDAANTPDGHSDIDLSYKLLAAGYRCVYTPYSLLTHVGNHSWNAKSRKYKADIFCLKRWGRYVSRDPYFTETMKRVLYTDFTYEYRIYAEHIDPSLEYTGPDVLFISHELTHTGAPHMLLVAARAVKAAGGFPVVVSPTDGPLRKIFVEAGIAVIIDASVTSNHFLFERFARNFDLAVVNTSVLRPVVEQLAKLPSLRVLWWLHESQSLPDDLKDVEPVVWDRTRVLCVSNYAKGYLPRCIESHVLLNGLPDRAARVVPSTVTDKSTKLVFLVLGTIEPRKGQDLFVEAILGLPKSVRAECHFVIAGKKWEGHRPFWSAIEDKIADIPEISMRSDVPPEKALSLVVGCDVVVVCSRDDSFSLVAAEAAQMSKPTILSDHVGAREVFDSRCAFTFPTCDVEALRARIVEAHAHRARLVKMGHAARKVFEEKLTEVKFARNFMALVSDELALDPTV